MGLIILFGSPLVLLFMSSFLHKSKLLIRCLDMFVEWISVLLVTESFMQHVFRRHSLGAGNEGWRNKTWYSGGASRPPRKWKVPQQSSHRVQWDCTRGDRPSFRHRKVSQQGSVPMRALKRLERLTRLWRHWGAGECIWMNYWYRHGRSNRWHIRAVANCSRSWGI